MLCHNFLCNNSSRVAATYHLLSGSCTRNTVRRTGADHKLLCHVLRLAGDKEIHLGGRLAPGAIRGLFYKWLHLHCLLVPCWKLLVVQHLSRWCQTLLVRQSEQDHTMRQVPHRTALDR